MALGTDSAAEDTVHGSSGPDAPVLTESPLSCTAEERTCGSRVQLGCSIGGVGLLLCLPIVRGTRLRSSVALAAFLLLAAAALAAFARAAAERRREGVVGESHSSPQRLASIPGRRGRLIAPGVLAVFSGVVGMSWFHGGMSVGGGDVYPATGAAWSGRTFAPWVASGQNLGGPNQLTLRWLWVLAVKVGSIVHLGPSAMAAAWCVGLFVGAGLAAYLLMRQFGSGAIAAVVGSLLYLLSPYTLTYAAGNVLFMVPMLLIPFYCGIFAGVGRGKVSVSAAALLIASTGPLLAYTFLNPPLTAMMLVVLLSAPAAGLAVFGRTGGLRIAKATVAGGGMLLAVSLYWVIPSLLSLGTAAIGQLSSQQGWTWTEIRATLQNGFWLNNLWTWHFAGYQNAVGWYASVPLRAMRWLPACIAFSSLALTAKLKGALVHAWIGSTAVVSLLVIFLSTGTLSPGSILFDHLYSLPFGWLLREPGRFLVVPALGYGVLTAGTIDGIWRQIPRTASRLILGSRPPSAVSRLAAVSGVAAVILLQGWPLVGGSFVGTPRDVPALSHVRVPEYWSAAASYLNKLPERGYTWLAPVDDFYQMPYTWGYYGTDQFISDMIKQPLLDPNGQGYWKTNAELLSAVHLMQTSLDARNWGMASRMFSALNVSDVLVRGDVSWRYPGRAIADPVRIAAALAADPSARLLGRWGPLELFHVSRSNGTVRFATVSATSPNLMGLAALPAGYGLVTRSPSPTAPIEWMPSPSTWRVSGHEATVYVPALPGKRYRAGLVHVSDFVVSPVTPVERQGANGRARYVLRFKLGDAGLVHSFSRDLWQRSVGDCNDIGGPRALLTMSATRLVHAGPFSSAAMKLSATQDSACESSPILHSASSLLIRLYVRRLQGGQPRMCIWSAVLKTCLPSPELPANRRWRAVSFVLDTPLRVYPLRLFLYADSQPAGGKSVEEYADISATAVRSLPVLVAFPRHISGQERIVVAHTTFSPLWRMHQPARHVVWDGLENAWLVPRGRLLDGHPYLGDAWVYRLSESSSAVAALALLSAVTVTAIRRRVRNT